MEKLKDLMSFVGYMIVTILQMIYSFILRIVRWCIKYYKKSDKFSQVCLMFIFISTVIILVIVLGITISILLY